MADYSAMSTGVGKLNYSFSTSTAAEFGVKVENASGRPNHYREHKSSVFVIVWQLSPTSRSRVCVPI
ncbi:hypothetical protein [Weissella confusa]|uniref:hypothetical protein n=1 Tax=Weissella confusa TaxID=1583 RepID=UPI001FD9B950|nr:hypothetical protein [Weissella confusa]